MSRTTSPSEKVRTKNHQHESIDSSLDAIVQSAFSTPTQIESIPVDEASISSVSQESTDQPSQPLQKNVSSVSNNPDLSVIPARMLNEFVYCARLFYYEFVEGVFLQNADTLSGKNLHSRVDNGSGTLPPPRKETSDTSSLSGESSSSLSEENQDVIHSRSVHLSSERLGVTAKMDLVEVRTTENHPLGELFAQKEVCPVDYKIGAPREGENEKELWDTDKMQLGLQCLILRDNGYLCNEGVIYYRKTKQRVRLEITPELEIWIQENIHQARKIAHGPIPPPLSSSPKCVRCSLAPVCLPDETHMLTEVSTPSSPHPPRRLIAARDDRRALYLNTPGLHVGKSHEVLQVRDKKTLLQEARINDVNHIALFGNIQISTQAIQTLCQADIPVSYFSMGNWFYGITRGHSLKNVFLRIEQFRQAALPEFSLQLARLLIHGKIRNHRTLLMRNHIEPPAPTLLRMKEAANNCLEATSLESLLGIEGAAASLYFQSFSGMIKYENNTPLDDTLHHNNEVFRFDFNTRNRRPPTDPVNALLSLAYSLLAKDCTIAAYAVGLDPYIGFYHQPRFGRPALALDIMEEFRPLIAESAVLTAINNRMITPDDFIKAGNAVNLSPAGRKQFFTAYEQRMGHLVTHPIFDYKVSYRRAIELQFRLLARCLTGEIPEYISFMTR